MRHHQPDTPGATRPESVEAGLHRILDAFQRPAWMADGLCIEYPHLEFIPASTAQEKAVVDELAAVCDRCLVRADCFRYGLAHRDLVGIWGGSTTAQRRRARRAERAA